MSNNLFIYGNSCSFFVLALFTVVSILILHFFIIIIQSLFYVNHLQIGIISIYK